MPSQEFYPCWFQEPALYEEHLWCDRKQDLYGDLRHQEKVAEFIRDMIALANSARLHGKPARLLCGIDDNGHLCDLSAILQDKYATKNADGAWGEVRKRAREALDCVVPKIQWQLEHGVIDEKQVGCFLIPPQSSPEPFQVARDYPPKNENPRLTKGQAWIRHGESKQEIGPQLLTDERWRDYWQVIPYLLPSHWEAYFEERLKDADLNAAYTLRAYQEPHFTNGQLAMAVFEDFETSPDHLLVIRGVAGCGKTTAIRRWIYQLTEDNLAAMRGVRQRFEIHPPTLPVPIYFRLREVRDELTSKLLETLNIGAQAWKGKPERLEEMFEQDGVRWMVFLDGLDEIWSDEKYEKTIEAVQHFARKYPKVKIVLTTRSESQQPNWNEWLNARICDVASLSGDKIEQYIEARVPVDQPTKPLMEILQSNEDVRALCGTPLFLEAIVNAYLSETQNLTSDAAPLSIEADQASPLYAQTARVDEESSPSTHPTIPHSGNVRPEIINTADLELDEPTEKDKSKGEEPSDKDAQDKPEDEESSDEDTLTVVTLGKLLNRAFTDLWKRERRRLDLLKDSQDWWERLSKLAAVTDGHQPSFTFEKAKRKLTKRGLYQWLSLGILFERNRLLQFVNDTCKQYFAASYILALECTEPPMARKWIERMTQPFSAGLRAILADLTAADLESIFGEEK